MNIINISHLTKNYGNNKGVFDVSLQIKKGEVYGYLGPNGAGKSTTMRHLMGFSKPESGSVSISNYDCWKEQKKIQKIVGYLPGEISFPDDMTGIGYLKLISKMRNMKDFSYAQELLDYFEINPKANIKSMSKGMKQKIGIVSAFMHKPKILLLDEPSSGLDPLMQSKLIDLIKREKKNETTIILSSHIFEEIEKTCDRIGMIRNGKLIKEVTIDEFKHSRLKRYKIEFKDNLSFKIFQDNFKNSSVDENKKQSIVSIKDNEINKLINILSKCDVKFLKEEKYTLEEYFMQFYGGEKNV